jgi:hypothetical protein
LNEPKILSMRMLPGVKTIDWDLKSNKDYRL